MSDRITLRLPASSRFVATARVTTASLAAELEFSVDRIEELRVGVNELVAYLVEWAEDNSAGEVELGFVLDGGDLEVIGNVVGRTPDAEADGPDSLTVRILDGVTDEHELGGGSGRILKRRGDG